MVAGRSLSPTAGPSGRGSERSHGGRYLDASRDDALRQAALELVAEIGYDRLTVEAVAARVGAGKATVYRRWSNKAELVADAMAHERIGAEAPDTGSLRGDLAALSAHLLGGGDCLSQYKIRLITGMVSAVLVDPELRRATEKIATPPERAVAMIIERAVARGEIAAPPDPGMVAAVLPALGVHRLIFTGATPDPAFAEAVIDNIVLPALLARPAPKPKKPPRPTRRD